MINSQEIKIGTCIRMDGGIWKCVDFQHRKPGKGNTVMNTKLKNVADGRVLERTFQVGFKLDDVRVEHRPYQYLYEDGTGCIFMNQETFEQIPIARDMITGAEFMKEGDIVELNLRCSHSKATRMEQLPAERHDGTGSPTNCAKMAL